MLAGLVLALLGFVPTADASVAAAVPINSYDQSGYIYDGTPHTYDRLDHFALAHAITTAAVTLAADAPAPPNPVSVRTVAAKSVNTAKPWELVRTEALSGRASARNVNEIADSMRANGWQGDPIKVVELNGQRIVVDGHHRLAAARQAGIDVQYEVVDPSTVIGPNQWSSVDDILRDAATVGPNRIR